MDVEIVLCMHAREIFQHSVFDMWAEIDLQKATGETSYCKTADIVVFETTDLSLASDFSIMY